MSNVKKCAIYARSRHIGPGGVVDQIMDCRREAEALGWNVDEDHIYYDNPREAAVTIEKRAGIQSLLSAANNAPQSFEMVIVSDVSRFSRKVQDILMIFRLLSKDGVDVHLVNGPAKSSRRIRESKPTGAKRQAS